MPAFANPVEHFKKEDGPALKRPEMAMTDCRMANTGFTRTFAQFPRIGASVDKPRAYST